MELLYTPAIAYDTWFYLVLYYNPNDRINIKYNKADNFHGKEFNGIAEVKNILPELPKLIAPFFMLREKGSILSKFMFPFIKYEFYDISYYISRIENHKEDLYKHIINSYFNTDACEFHNSAEYIDKITELDISIDIKLHLSLVLGNFDYAVSILSETVKKVYSVVKYVHDKSKDITEFAFSEIQKEENIARYRNYLKASDEIIQKAIVCIPLLNRDLIMHMTKNEENLILMYGFDHLSIYPQVDGKEYPLEKFFDACSSALRFKILRILAESGEKTLKELSEYINMNPSSVLHNVRALLDAGILAISRTEQKCVYYEINKNCMRGIKKGLDMFFNSIAKEN